METLSTIWAVYFYLKTITILVYQIVITWFTSKFKIIAFSTNLWWWVRYYPNIQYMDQVSDENLSIIKIYMRAKIPPSDSKTWPEIAK